MPHYFLEQFGDLKVDEALSHFKELTAEAVPQIIPFSGIPELLNLLRSKGIQLAVWTARDYGAAMILLEASGLKPFFSVIVTGDCVAQGKPHPEGLSQIAAHFKCEPKEMLMIGDFDSDMLGAKAFGIQAIRVLWHSSVEQKRCPTATWQFSQVAEMRTWVDTLKASSEQADTP